MPGYIADCPYCRGSEISPHEPHCRYYQRKVLQWKCNKCQNEYDAVPGLVRTTVKQDGTIESAQPCECGGWRILQDAQQSVQRTGEQSTAAFDNSDLHSDDREDSNPLFFTRIFRAERILVWNDRLERFEWTDLIG